MAIGESVETQMKRFPKITFEQLKKLRGMSGMNIPIIQDEGYTSQGNAAYYDPDSANELLENNIDNLNTRQKAEIKKNPADYGLVVYGPKMDKLPVIAHEFGHARSHREGRAPSFLGNALISAALPIAGGIALGAGGYALGNSLSGDDGAVPISMLGVLGGLVGGSIAGNMWIRSRTRDEEHRASTYAKEWLKSIYTRARAKSRYNASIKALNSALSTYGADPIAALRKANMLKMQEQ